LDRQLFTEALADAGLLLVGEAAARAARAFIVIALFRRLRCFVKLVMEPGRAVTAENDISDGLSLLLVGQDRLAIDDRLELVLQGIDLVRLLLGQPLVVVGRGFNLGDLRLDRLLSAFLFVG
jgi:hypothetical protein